MQGLVPVGLQVKSQGLLGNGKRLQSRCRPETRAGSKLRNGRVGAARVRG